MQVTQDPYSYRNDSEVPAFDDSAPIAVMDAECALCSWGARTIHHLDKSGLLRICPVQSPLGSAILQHYEINSLDPESWLFLEDGTSYQDMEAVIRVGQRLGGWGNLVLALKLVPRPLRSWLYLRVARNRYRLFGKGDMCAIPDPDFQKRLMR
ncbi:putative thiol-disulfide oxidoreductase DCC [Roseibium sp. TrichSKD4]|uniref:thiol-disulfide oxidoreductase DCC family protein n=1 Tax=Roseibium sp. TrichSKD4 TaxID=744980 RepID=UPI0001E57456|nr:DUF393 domain-containing protein [Roseibium sp. TrichSKD4]EFO29259.1 putative thiol-disulfide oxidoreductase DCC [Roseibium sp. TrichSKD4]